ncbi:glycosyltransferase family 2 protein [Gordonia amicalis]|uniref:glycosyltransferase family 2 protein n=1 Tax=Gordonia amicalis TaxID=89053 RepID=UPI0022A69D61|nr:glycosyltransferase family 2 protein [Gordonia amicalis]MCZ0914468.1 glycosyltransferase family 2 protein [Gordonia amicalis]
MGGQLLIGVPVYGQQEMTHDLVRDLWRENADFVIIDNRGDYRPLGDERVERPGQNLGWAGGSNLGFRLAFSEGYANAMTLNNDTRLSLGYVAALLDPALPADLGMVATVYDDKYAISKMLSDYDGPAEQYVPRHRYREMTFIDGTGLLITRDAWRAVGGLDERTFGDYAWGADRDLSARVRDAGFKIYVTERGFMNHLRQKTVSTMTSASRYKLRAYREMTAGMRRIGMRHRLKADDEAPYVVHDFDHRVDQIR